MSNTYINSSSVNVFPTALRTRIGTGKFTSEENITGIIRAVANNSYIISYPSDENLYTGDWEFIIYGYYFGTSGVGLSTGNNIYAQIKLDNSGRLVAWDGSVILDDGDLFKALYITSDSPGVDVGNVHTLQLISNGVVNPEALYEVNSDRVRFNLPGSGTLDLQTQITSMEDNIDVIERDIDSIEDNIGEYAVETDGTISARLDYLDKTNSETITIDTTKGAVGKNAGEIVGIKNNISSNYVRKTSTSSDFYTNAMNNAGIQFVADESNNSEYNNKGVSFSTGNTGVSAKQNGSTGSILGVRAESSVNIGVSNSTKFSVGSSETITYNKIIPDTTNTKDLGQSDKVFSKVWGNEFSGKANTAGTSDKLGNTTIGQGPTGTGPVVSKTMYLDDGTATEGITITFSTSEPSGGKNGDIWFKYNA